MYNKGNMPLSIHIKREKLPRKKEQQNFDLIYREPKCFSLQIRYILHDCNTFVFY